MIVYGQRRMKESKQISRVTLNYVFASTIQMKIKTSVGKASVSDSANYEIRDPDKSCGNQVLADSAKFNNQN